MVPSLQYFMMPLSRTTDPMLNQTFWEVLSKGRAIIARPKRATRHENKKEKSRGESVSTFFLESYLQSDAVIGFYPCGPHGACQDVSGWMDKMFGKSVKRAWELPLGWFHRRFGQHASFWMGTCRVKRRHPVFVFAPRVFKQDFFDSSIL